MIRLYHCGGSHEIQVLGKPVDDRVWTTIRQQAIRLLQSKRGASRAAEILRTIPFEFRQGTNGFNDDFRMLYYPASLDKYVALAEANESNPEILSYESIAFALAELDYPVRFIVLDLVPDTGTPSVTTPSLAIQCDAVERALADAEHLLRDRGAASGVDRIHTALHGYLRAVARRASLPVPDDPSVTQLFKVLREQHPALRAAGPRTDDIERVLRSLATIIDALNPVRNRASGAHPNQVVLAEAEAMLVINAVKSMLHYVDARLRSR